MRTKHSGKIEALKDAIIAAINGTRLQSAREVSATALKTVRKTVTKSIRGVTVVAKDPEPAWFSNN